MPKPNIFSAVRYADAPSVISFLVEAFGFARHEVHAAPDGTIAHAELRLGTGLLMLGSATPPDPANPWSAVAAGIYAALATPADVDAHHARAVRAGADVVRPLETTSYGSREYSARDLEGHLWSFGTYNPRRKARRTSSPACATTTATAPSTGSSARSGSRGTW
jgi:uncharacterized glyoxalase superfamily protein PhnB